MPTELGKVMNELIRGAKPQPTRGQDKADQIRAYYKQGLQQIRGDRNMHPDRRRIEIAQLYATTRDALAKVKNDQVHADRTTFAQLERRLWGYDDVRATAPDRATIDATIRDAQDRAAQLKKPSQAARALAEAEQAGDNILARAIAKRAHDMDWAEPVADYLASRPGAAELYQQAGDIYHRQNAPQGVMALQHIGALGKPEELRGLDDKTIQSMADPQDSAA
ncbi:hypothetical protein [Streptomyces althioticus]|jgi:hypothetical protein|uniref:hypothetical protein n=1 Tax=Streptomyces althioticus TaxID=83380 RepID=UPI003321FDE2